MTKADIVTQIADKTGIEKLAVQTTIDAFMQEVKTSMTDGENVYLRGFGSFILKKRAKKKGRNIVADKTVIIPEHYVPIFKPAKLFSADVSKKVKK